MDTTTATTTYQLWREAWAETKRLSRELAEATNESLIMKDGFVVGYAPSDRTKALRKAYAAADKAQRALWDELTDAERATGREAEGA